LSYAPLAATLSAFFCDLTFKTSELASAPLPATGFHRAAIEGILAPRLIFPNHRIVAR
jgi:hypothetical protein